MKKRHHHYVWREYLRAWAPDDYIWCCRNGKIFRPNLMGIGQERDFYKLKQLSQNDIYYIKKIAIEPSQKNLKEINEGWLQIFNLVFEFRQYFDENGINHPELDKLLDEAEHNLEENYHTLIEGEAIKFITSILKQDISFYYTDDGCMNFAFYLCMQYMRTNKIKKSIMKNLANVNRFSVENSWPVMRHIFTTNMAWSLFADRERFRMVLVKNETDMSFIAGDQPVINTYASEKLGNEIVEKVEFYYPVSPKLAILISEKEQFKSVFEIDICVDDVVKYNNAICKSSHEQIYGDSEETIEIYIDCKKNKA